MGNTTLYAASCHPLHTLKAIPIGELTRAKENYSTQESFKLETYNICNPLKKRRYPFWMLNITLDGVAKLNIEQFLSDKKDKTTVNTLTQPMVFSTSYSMQYGRVTNIIHKYLPILHTDPGFLNSGHRCVAGRAATLGNIMLNGHEGQRCLG